MSRSGSRGSPVFLLAAAVRDLRHATRALARSRAFSLVAVLTLGLGIGAATAMYTVVDGVLLRPLPFPDAGRVVSIWTRFLPESGYNFDRFPLSGPELLDYRTQSHALGQVAAYLPTGALVEGRDGRDSVRVQQVLASSNLFATLAVQPEVGRGFVAGEDQPGAPCVAVLSHGLWLDAFGGDPASIGGPMRIGGEACTVVGVMAPGFVFPDSSVRLWRNLILDPASPGWGRKNHNFSAVGRLAPGVTLAQADAERTTLMAAWAREYPDHHKGHFVYLRPLLEDVVGDVGSGLTLLFVAAGFLLAIICANLASLMLARGERRRRELGVRLALGCGRGRLITQLLAESFVLAAGGGALGSLFGVFIVKALLSVYPGTLPRADAISIDWRAYVFTVAAAAGSALLFGLVPALRATSIPPAEATRSQGRGAAGQSRAGLMRALVVAQVALSVTLVAGAGMLLRSYENLRAANLGFDADGVYTVSQALPASAYPDAAGIRAFYASLIERVAALPSVRSVGATSSLPLTGGTGPRDDFVIEGRPDAAPGEQQPNAGFVQITPGYFETLRIPLLAGRGIEPGDVRDAPWVAVINDAAAKRYWANEDPVGKRLHFHAAGDEKWITIVGVVANTRVNGARADPEPQLFVPHAQAPRDTYPGRLMTIVVRAAGDPAPVAAAVRDAIRAADRSLPLIGGQLMTDVVSASVGQPRFTSQIVLFFASAALLLGALGIHGVLSYVVAQRVGELGVRVALGARPGAVLRFVLRQGMGLAAIGVVIGVGATLALAQLLRSLLFAVRPVDAISVAAAVALLAVAALLACLGPARRAARIDPIAALRAE